MDIIHVAVRSLTIAKTLDLLEVRARSLYALTANVFLHRVRRLVYDKTFADPRYDRTPTSRKTSCSASRQATAPAG